MTVVHYLNMSEIKKKNRRKTLMAEFDISRATVFRDYAKIKKITGAVYDKNESGWKL